MSHALPIANRGLAAVGVLMVAGLIIRLHGIDDSVLTFHPTRQYRSAIIARDCYYDRRTDLPLSVRDVARSNRAMQPAGEPPLMEWAACAAYRAAGRESLAMPRTLAALAWVIGAIPLVLIGRRSASAGATTIGAAVYLFAPYAVVASRAFQPDPLMTCCSLFALWLLVQEHERGTGAALAAAAAGVAIAMVVKPMSAFLLLPAGIGLAIARAGVRRVWLDRRLGVLLCLGLLPAVLVYGYSTLVGTLARDQWQMRFVPSLLDSSFFWGGWWTQIRRVFGVPLLVAGVGGLWLARARWMRALLASLWIGYAMFAVAFTYHMPTHDYYHLPFIAVAALGAAMAADALLTRIGRRGARVPVQAAGLLVAGLLAASGTLSAWPKLQPGAVDRLRDFEAIGELCAHDTRVLFLDREYGYPLMYHAGISGDAWPSTDDLAAEALGGAPPIAATERFQRDFADYAPRYFVATDLASLEAQPDLQELLRGHATLVAATLSYRVYRFHARPRD